MTADSARAWLEGLAARGIATRLVNGRIRHFPGTAYKQLSDEEIIFLRHHRAEIRDALRAGPPVQVATLTPSEGVAPTLAPAPEPCPYCYQQPCIGEQHELYDLLHPLTEAQAFARRMEQLAKDAREWEMRRILGLPPPTWDLDL